MQYIWDEFDRRRNAHPQGPYLGDQRWEQLIANWRSLYTTELETLWEFAAVATQVADEFGEEAIKYFAHEVHNPEHMVRRAIASYRNRHLQSDELSGQIFRSEREFVEYVQKQVIASESLTHRFT